MLVTLPCCPTPVLSNSKGKLGLKEEATLSVLSVHAPPPATRTGTQPEKLYWGASAQCKQLCLLAKMTVYFIAVRRPCPIEEFEQVTQLDFRPSKRVISRVSLIPHQPALNLGRRPEILTASFVRSKEEGSCSNRASSQTHCIISRPNLKAPLMVLLPRRRMIEREKERPRQREGRKKKSHHEPMCAAGSVLACGNCTRDSVAILYFSTTGFGDELQISEFFEKGSLQLSLSLPLLFILSRCNS
jgi:hypothetical protein